MLITICALVIISKQGFLKPFLYLDITLVSSEQSDTGRKWKERKFRLKIFFVKISGFSRYVSCLKNENILDGVSGKPEKEYTCIQSK